jgi:PhoPQ-activated pathogenicity-related protein
MYTPEAQRLRQIVDPLNYNDLLTMPKYIVSSAGDQFFVPDSSELFFHKLKGENRMRYVPNSDHGLGGTVKFNFLLKFKGCFPIYCFSLSFILE